jgi:Bacterial PH domain
MRAGWARGGGGSVPRVDLQRGESLVLVARPARSVVWPRYLVTLGVYGIWRKRHTFVLTDRRVLIGRGVLVRTERSIPLDRVHDAVYRRRGLAAYCELVGVGRGGRHVEHRVEQIGPLSPLRARRFTAEVLARC